MANEKWGLGSAVMIAQKMAHEVAELHFGRSLGWYRADILGEEVQRKDANTETRRVIFDARLDFVGDELGHVLPAIHCYLVYENLRHWLPRKVAIYVPRATTRYTYTPNSIGITFFDRTWRIEKVVYTLDAARMNGTFPCPVCGETIEARGGNYDCPYCHARNF